MASSNTTLEILVKMRDEASAQMQKMAGVFKSSWQDSVDASQQFATGLLAGGTAMVGLGGFAIKAAADLEMTTVAFNTMLGSTEKATTLLKQLATFAATTPFELTEIQKASKSMLAFGIAAQDIVPSLTNIGNIASGIGVPIGDLAVIYGKARTQGTLFAEDINQLTERGVPIIAQLAKQFNVSEGSVKGLVSEGKVGFKDLQVAFESMAGAGGQFGGLMAAQSGTLLGKWSNLQDAWGQFLAGEGKKLIDWAKKFVDVVINLVQNVLPQWIKKAEELGSWVEKNKTSIAIFAGVITALLVPAFVSAAAAIGKAIFALTVGNPWGLAIGAIVALALAIYLNWDAIKAKTIEIWNSVTKWLSDTWNGITATAQSVWGGITSFFQGIWEGIKEVFKFGAALAVGAVITYFNFFGIDIVRIFQSIVGALQAVWTTIQATFSAALTQVQGVWNTVWTAISGFVAPIWEGIKKTIGEAWKWMSDKFNEYSKPITDAWTIMWNGMGDVVTAMWKGITDAFKSSINWIIDGINKVIGALNSVANKGGSALGMKPINIATIPRLATGGIVTSPTLALIGEAGPEAVVPLSGGNRGGYGGLTIINNFNNPVGMDKRQAEKFGDLIIDKLRLQLRGNY